MRVLLFSHDKTLFRADGDSRRRMREYASFCERLLVVVPVVGSHPSEVREGNLRIVPATSSSRLGLFWALRKLACRLARAEDINLVVSQDPFEFGLIALTLKRRFDVRVLVELHGDFYSTDWWKRSSVVNWIRYHLGKRVLKRADGVRAVSERIRSSLVSRLGIPERKIIVFPVPTDVERFLAAPASTLLRDRYPGFDFFFLTVGGLSKVKNVALQLRSLARLVERFPGAALVVLGEGPERPRLGAAARKLGVASRVVFGGEVSDPLPYYRSADAFLLTSEAEGWGRAVVEAMASGLAVIMTDVGLAGELLKDGENGLVVPRGDERALASAMRRMLEDAALRRRLGEAARRAAGELPSRNTLLEQYRRSWERCVSS